MVARVQWVHFCGFKVFWGLNDKRASRRNIRLTASMLLPFKSGRRSKISASSALAAFALRGSSVSTDAALLCSARHSEE